MMISLVGPSNSARAPFYKIDNEAKLYNILSAKIFGFTVHKTAKFCTKSIMTTVYPTDIFTVLLLFDNNSWTKIEYLS